MNNVINLNKSKIEIPNDLMSFKGFALKHNMNIGYLYKLFYGNKIKRYKRGVWKVSEDEVLRVLQRVE